MINSIIEAISVALNTEFGDDYEIHMEEIKQGLTEPCFFISCLKPTYELFLGKRYFRQIPFCIQYFPVNAEYQRECNGVADRMNECLEYITVDGDEKPIRGTDMKCEVVDGVLNYFVNYDLFIRKVETDDAMESLEESTSVKEGG